MRSNSDNLDLCFLALKREKLTVTWDIISVRFTSKIDIYCLIILSSEKKTMRDTDVILRVASSDQIILLFTSFVLAYKYNIILIFIQINR